MSRKNRYPRQGSFKENTENPQVLTQTAASDAFSFLEFSPKRQSLLNNQAQPLSIRGEHQIDESVFMQSEANTTRSTYVMAPICMNTPAASQ